MIVNSLLDQEFCKFLASQFALHQLPNVTAEYILTFEDKDKSIIEELKEEIKYLCELKFKSGELDFLNRTSYFKSSYLEYLRTFNLNYDFIKLNCNEKEVEIKINGPWFCTILFKTPLLAIINEIYYENNIADKQKNEIEGSKKLNENIKLIRETDKINLNFSFIDTGTKIRYSKSWHYEVLSKFLEKVKDNIVGTTNVMMAKHFGLKLINMMTHEIFMVAQALETKLDVSQDNILKKWIEEYEGLPGFVVTDTIRTDIFLENFSLYYAKLFDGMGQNSSDSYEWCEKILQYYNKIGIEPKTKTVIFNNELAIEEAIEVAKRFSGVINCIFGISDGITNNLENNIANFQLNLVKCSEQIVAKITDDKEKETCEDKGYTRYIKKTFGIK